MAKRYSVLLMLVIGFISGSGTRIAAQQDGTRFRVSVDLVQLNVAVTDSKGNYVTGLKPTDFIISEDGITEKIATFEEGNGPTRRLLDAPPEAAKAAAGSGAQGDGSPSQNPNETLGEAIAGANVFILFDTSNYMYRGFVFAQDAISDFVRSLETADKVAFYSYSRDLYRSAPLTADRVRGGSRRAHHGRRGRRRALQLAFVDVERRLHLSPAEKSSSSSPTGPTMPAWCRPKTSPNSPNPRHSDLHDQHPRSKTRARLDRRL